MISDAETLRAKVEEAEQAQLRRLINVGKLGGKMSASDLRELDRLATKYLPKPEPKPEPPRGLVVATAEDLAKHYQKSERTIRRWVVSGCPQRADGSFDTGLVDEWLAAGGSRAANRRRKQAEDSRSFWDKERLKQESRLKKLRFQIESGEFLKRSDVVRQWTARAQLYRQGLTSLPRVLAPLIVGVAGVDEAMRIIQTQVENLLRSVTAPIAYHEAEEHGERE